MDIIQEWLDNNTYKLDLEIEMENPIGRVAYRTGRRKPPYYAIKDTQWVSATLIRNESEQGWYLLTLFPFLP